MRLKQLADETEEYETESKNLETLEFYTEADHPETVEVLELVTAAAMQSGLRYRKTIVDDEAGYETVVLDASDAEAVVLQSIYTDLADRDADYTYGTTEHDQDIVTISYQFKEPEEDTEEE